MKNFISVVIFLLLPTLVWATPPNTTAVPLQMQTTPCSATQLVIGAGTGNPPICGTIGTNLSWSGTTLNASGSGGGAVSSVFGRTGAVTATSGDYSSTQITGAINLAGTGNGGVTGTLPVGNGGTGATSFTTNAPLIGGSTIGVGSRSGNTTVFGTTTGTLTNGHCVSIDASGNLVDAGGACTTGGGGGTVASGTANQIGYYASSGATISGLATATNGVLITSGGAPSISSTLPSAVQANITTVGTVGTGVWQGTAPGVPYGGTGGTSFTAYSPVVGGTTSTGALQSAGSLGVAGYILTSNGTGAVPTFQAPAGGTGTVTSVSVASANGFAGSVATSTTTPAITLSTTANGVLKGNGTAISAATAGMDYQAPVSLTTSGTSGAATYSSNVFNIPQYQGALTLTTTGSSGAATLSGTTLNIPQYSGSAVTSVTAGNGLSSSPYPITSTGTIIINDGYANTWTVGQTFNASTTMNGISNTGAIYTTGLFTLDNPSNAHINYNLSGTNYFSTSATTSVYEIATNSGGSTGVYLTSGGSSWATISDERLPYKKTARPYSVLNNLKGVKLYENEVNGTTETFVKAQELYKSFPTLVKKGDDDPNYIPDGPVDPRAWGVHYDRAGVIALAGLEEINNKLTACLASWKCRLLGIQP